MVITTPAHTARGVAGKRRVARRANFDDEDGIIAFILQNDAERIAV